MVVSDVTNLPFNTGSFISEKLQGFDSTKNIIKTFGLDKIAYAVAQKASEKMTRSIINKINGGASGDGSVNYITNFKQHFSDIGSQQITSFSNELRSSSNPFARSAERGLIDRISGFVPSGLNNFTLNRNLPSGVEVSDVAKDLSLAGNQGLAFYSQLALPQNTPMGASMIAQENLAQRISSAQRISEIELLAPGFIGSRDSSCVSRNPTEEEQFNININLDCAITTPGNVVGGLANLALEEPIVRNRMADDFIKIVANSLTQITSSAINKGFSSLKQNLSGGGTRPNLYFGSPGEDRVATSTSGNLGRAPTVIIDLNKELNESIPRVIRAVETTKKTLEFIRLIPEVAADLDICTPGPDIKWEDRLRDYFQKSTKGLQRTASRDNNNGEEAEKILTQMESQFDIAIQEMKLAMNNPYRNIPGVSEASILVQTTSQKTTLFSKLFSDLLNYQNSLNILRNIKGTVQSNVVGYQYPTNILDELSPGDRTILQGIGKLILFAEDWNNATALSQAQKEALYRAAIIRIPQTSPLSTTNPDRDNEMQKIVLEYQWELWDDYMSSNEERADEKQKLFSQIYELRDSNPTETQITQIINQQNQIKGDIQTLAQAVNNCLLIRSIFITAVKPSPFSTQNISQSSLPQIQYELDENQVKIIPFPQRVAISNIPLFLTTATRLANRNYTLSELPDLKEELALMIPEKTIVLRELLIRPSILDATDDEILGWSRKNALGENYQILVPATTVAQILEQDTKGYLFCALPSKNFKDDPGARRWDPMPCNPIDIDENKASVIFNPIGALRDSINRVKNRQATDIIANTELNPLRDTRKEYMQIPLNWYFSSGITDYINFDAI